MTVAEWHQIMRFRSYFPLSCIFRIAVQNHFLYCCYSFLKMFAALEMLHGQKVVESDDERK